MALEQKLNLKLSQRLVMTPSLQQAIKMLQMTRLELSEAVNQEVIENPVLEDAADEEETPTPATAATPEAEAAPPAETAEPQKARFKWVREGRPRARTSVAVSERAQQKDCLE